MTTTKSELQPIDFATIRECMSVVIRQKGGEWDKREGKLVNWSEDEGKVLIEFKGFAWPVQVPASIVYHLPATEPQPALQKVDVAKLKVNEPVYINIPEPIASVKPSYNNKIGLVNSTYNGGAYVRVQGEGILMIGQQHLYYPPVEPQAPQPEQDIAQHVSHSEMTFNTGEEVITKNFESNKDAWFFPLMHNYVDVKGLIEIGGPVTCKVHGYWWPASALERVPVKQGQPILIELEKAVQHLDGYLHWAKPNEIAEYFQSHFSRFENQYHLPQPEEQQASPVQPVESEEWVPEIKDVVKITANPKNLIFSKRLHAGATGEIEGFNEFQGEIDLIIFGKTFKKSEVTLVKKADTMQQPSFAERMDEYWQTQGKPFPLPEARQMYQQGGKAQEVALRYWGEEELERKDLPMRIQDAFNRGYGTQNEGMLAAIDHLLKLREDWLLIEGYADWKPDWLTESIKVKNVLYRYNSELVVHGVFSSYSPFSFPTEDLATRFLAAFHPLILTAFCLPADNQEGGGE